MLYTTHKQQEAAAGTDSSATDCSGRAQAHTRPNLGENSSQQRRGEKGNEMVERSGGVDELINARRYLLLVPLLLL